MALMLKVRLPQLRYVARSYAACIPEKKAKNPPCGHRDVVGFFINGEPNYKDDAHFPFPSVRWKENTPDVLALREKEKGDWHGLSLQEKKCLYRASFCQTFSEFQHPSGQWKGVIGWTLLITSIAFWLRMFTYFYISCPVPMSFCEGSQKAQLRRMLDLRVNPVDGLSSKWDYKNDCWK